MKKTALSIEPEQILSTPFLNKGSAFTQQERDELKLHGLIPYHISTIQEQVMRRYENFCAQPDAISRYTFLTSLQNRNEILFYRLVSEHISEMLPLIYTPTVGHASQHFSVLYHEGRGLYVSYPLKDKIPEIIARLPEDEVDIVVVTDGERILGLGDLGVGGMAIPVGKLALYTVFGGIKPTRTLPVHLDVGTNNPDLLKDPLYLGWRHNRISGKEYDEFVECFVQALKKRYPRVLLQWEDFGREHAHPLLERYRDTLSSFNDDIQGTASTVLAAVLAATRASGRSLKTQKIAMLGAGSAGLGICRELLAEMVEEGMSESEALENFYLVDIEGLIHTKLQNARSGQKMFAQKHEKISMWKVKNPAHISLLEVVENAEPSILIGVSTQAGAFTKEIVQAISRAHPRPIILPLSNPTSRCEAHPKDLIEWTDGRAIVATGSPFEPVEYKGKSYPIAQCNNVYIFPGVGLGVVSCQARKVTDKMFLKAARVLSDHAPILKNPKGALFPDFESLRAICFEIALGVAETALHEGVANSITPAELKSRIQANIWTPDYPLYTKG
ncbi:MAG: NAD-dependent malic enzyme [Chlamydiales bacterium]|nr:NAD-dependent malic enzyme [Chlamydiales bacterium]